MCTAGILVFVTGLWSSKAEIAAARGIEKVVTLYRVCFAIPLAVFGALHLCFSAMSLRCAEPRQLLARLGRDRGAGAAADLPDISAALLTPESWQRAASPDNVAAAIHGDRRTLSEVSHVALFPNEEAGSAAQP